MEKVFFPLTATIAEKHGSTNEILITSERLMVSLGVSLMKVVVVEGLSNSVGKLVDTLWTKHADVAGFMKIV